LNAMCRHISGMRRQRWSRRYQRLRDRFASTRREQQRFSWLLWLLARDWGCLSLIQTCNVVALQ
jgi:hypothetical protein